MEAKSKTEIGNEQEIVWARERGQSERDCVIGECLGRKRERKIRTARQQELCVH